MKTIKLQPREYAKLATGKELAEVPEYVKKRPIKKAQRQFGLVLEKKNPEGSGCKVFHWK